MRVIGQWVSLVLIVAFLGACASTPMRRSFKETWNDSSVKTALMVDIARDDQVRSRTINVDVFRGVVTLHGRSENAEERQRVAEIASRVPGVILVENHIVIRSDDDPRFAVREPVVSQDVFSTNTGGVVTEGASLGVGARSGEVPAPVTIADAAVRPAPMSEATPVYYEPESAVNEVQAEPAVATRKPFRRKSFFGNKTEAVSQPEPQAVQGEAPIIIQDSQAASDLQNEASAELKRLKSL